jgi:hypothetical protein
MEGTYEPSTVISEGVQKDEYKYNSKGNIDSVVTYRLINKTWVDSSKLVLKWIDDNNSFSIVYSTIVNGKWVDSARVTRNYNHDKLVISQTRELFKDMKWITQEKNTITYTENSTVEVYEGYQDDGNVEVKRWTNTYDEHHNMLSEVIETGVNYVFTYWLRDTYSYNERGGKVTYLREGWEDNKWVNVTHDLYIYDSNGNMASALTEDWESGAWVPERRITYTYDDNKNPVAESHEFYIDASSSWINSWKVLITYNSDGKILSKTENSWYDDQGWINSTSDVFTYSSSGKITSEIYEDYGYEASDYKYIYTYDNNDNFIKGECFNKNNGSWSPATGEFYITVPVLEKSIYGAKEIEIQYVLVSPAAIDGSSALPNEYKLYQNYPNPFNPSTKIKFTLPETARVTVRVYDMLGREVRKLVNTEQSAGTHEVMWNGDNDMGQKVASGIYLYSVSTNKFVQTKKMVLLK